MPRKDKRRQIMQAAEKLFATRRFHEITLDEVARIAQVGKGTIYLYFKDKDDLFFQTALAGYDDLCDVLEQRVPCDAPFEEQLLIACREISKFFQRRQQVYRMIQVEDARIPWCKGNIREAWKEKRQRVVAALSAIMRRGVDEGKVRMDIPAEAMANVLMGMLRMQAIYLVDHPGSERHIDFLVDLFYRGAGWVGGSSPPLEAASVEERNQPQRLRGF